MSWNLEWFPGLAPRATAEVKAGHIAAIKPEFAKINSDILLAQDNHRKGGDGLLELKVLTPHDWG